MATVTIGCRLPTGIVLNIYKPFSEEVVKAAKEGTLKNSPPAELLESVELAGQNQVWKRMNMLDSAILRDEDFGVTEVDESFWATWLSANKEFPALKSGAIFVTKKESDAKAMVKDMSKDESKKTGMAALSGVAPGIAAADK